MRYIATDVARSVHCVSVCLSFGTRVSCVEMAEPIQMPFRTLTHVGPKNCMLDGCQDQTNAFASKRGDKLAMRLFVKIL